MLRTHPTRSMGRSVAAIVIMTIAFNTAGCASSDSPPAEQSGEKMLTVRMPISPSITSSPLYVALERGYFEDEGIKVDTIPNLNPTQQVQLTAAGKAEFALVGVGSGTNNAAVRGNPLVFLSSAALIPGPDGPNARLIVTDSAWKRGIQDVASLKGETVNVFPGKGSASGYAVTKLLTSAGLKEGSDYRIRDWGSKTDLRSALIAGSVDVGYFTDPDSSLVLSKTDAHSIGSSADVVAGVMSTAIIGNREWVSSHKDASIGFLKGYLRGVDAVMDGVDHDWKDDSDVPDIVAKYAKVPTELMSDIGWSLYRRDGAFTDEIVKGLVEEMKYFRALGGIDEIADPKTYIDESYVQSAYDELKSTGQLE